MNEKEQQNCEGHKCHGGMCGGMCGCSHAHMAFRVLRLVLGIIVILMVFSLGMKIGEFKSEFGGGGLWH